MSAAAESAKILWMSDPKKANERSMMVPVLCTWYSYKVLLRKGVRKREVEVRVGQQGNSLEAVPI